MRRTLAVFILIIGLLTVAICTSGQQKAPGEFVSPIGEFGIMLPQSKVEVYDELSFQIGNDKLIAWAYHWDLDSDEVVIVYAIGKVDLEAKADPYLEKLRDHYAPGSVISQKKTSFAGHPGLVSVVDSDTRNRKVTRAMIWTYILKNRVYLMSLTLDDKARMEEHLKVMSTFRLLSPKDMEPRLTELVEELTPKPLPQAPVQSRPTTDAQDSALKGRVKTVVTESEPYVDGSLYGVREMFSVENYDEHGNLVKTVDYRDSLPRRVRLYGTHKGERAFLELRKVWRWVDYRDKNDSRDREVMTAPTIFTIKYKHAPDGQLVEKRVLRDGGKDVQIENYNLKAKTVTRQYDLNYVIRRTFAIGRGQKVVSTLDANGNSIEDAYQVMAGASYEPTYQSFYPGNFISSDRWYQHYKTDKERYEYIFDDRGNWIQQKTFVLTKDNQTVPKAVTYRTITYYQ